MAKRPGGSRIAPLRYASGMTYSGCMSTDSDHTASFGFRDVPAGEKEKLVRGVFSSVARNYDLMNDLMSAGVHRLWKDAMVDDLNPQPGWRVLDVAGGTGDIALRIAKAARRRGGEADITVCDINPDMLAEGVKRAEAKNETFAWIAGDAQALPLPDAGFDAYTIAFGIRNVTDISKALAEARRVLKPGGRFLCLEFSKVEVPGLDVLYDKFSFSVLPWIGEVVAGDGEAYRYLVESIRRFPPQSEFAKLIEAAGLAQVKVRNLSGGIAALHSAWKL
jgi:demethylmenaquinone methyltransferase / 2-methoxy-6-polyprenyl-1,4-benzoquinol methylase